MPRFTRISSPSVVLFAAAVSTVVVASEGCGGKVESTADAAVDAPTTVPDGASPIPIAPDPTCPGRADACSGDAAKAVDDLWAAIRACAPGSIANVCVFGTTVSVSSTGCADVLYTVARPPGIEAATADLFTKCVTAKIAAYRWSCLRGLIRPGPCS